MTLQLLVNHRSTRSYWQLWSLALLVFLIGAFKASAQPGNVCETPLAITTLPFDDAGNTSTYGNDYEAADVPPLATGAVTNGTGADSYLNGDDVVYAYTPSGDQVITITTTNDDDWIGLWAFTGCPFASTVGYHTSISGATRAINNLPVLGGTTYYIVLSTWGSVVQSTAYTIHVEQIVPCTGTPDPGATTGPDHFCPGMDFTLGIENTTLNTGISYQWEVSSDGTTWANAPGTSTESTYTTSQTEAAWYRCQVTCAGGGTGTSTPMQMLMSPPNECYCIPTGASNNSDEIRNFTLSDLNNSSAASEGSNGYMDYTGSVPAAQLLAGIPYVASLTNGPGSGNHGAAIWIDIDDNGIFDASEMVASIPNTITPSTTVSFPAFNAVSAGVHRLRVQYRYAEPGSTLTPCVASIYSETEDYLVEISGNVGIEGSLNVDGVSVFPNPARTELFISTPNNKPVHVKVYNMVGHLMMEMDMTTHLNVADLAPGSYILSISDVKGTIQARTRFMKQ